MQKSPLVCAAILKWPLGLDHPPIIFPCGETEEQDFAIIALLETVLGRRNDGE